MLPTRDPRRWTLDESSSLSGLSGHFHNELPGKKFFRAAHFFCFGFDPRGGDERFDIIPGNRDRVKAGKLIDDHAYSGRIAELVFRNYGSGDFFLVVSEKFHAAVDGAQDRDDTFRIGFDFLFARNDYDERKSRHEAADVE